MIYSIDHVTQYDYNDFVSYCHNIAMLRPRNLPGHEVLDFALEISPKPAHIREDFDYFGNSLTRFSIHELHKKLTVKSHALVARTESAGEKGAPMSLTIEESRLALAQVTPEILEAKQFTLESGHINHFSTEIFQYASKTLAPDRPLLEAAEALTQRIFEDFVFVPGFTTISTPLEEVMDSKKGVCQDFAHIAIACLRSQGLSARYVSGYIETFPPPGKPKLVGVDASHAWFSVYIPGQGWVDFDPTNNRRPKAGYVTVGWGRDYYDVPPLKGVIYTNGTNTLKVSVHMEPVEARAGS